MKRTFSANINGRIFNIDEDAFTLLNNYLDQLHQVFSGTEGSEIVGDIESRICELFEERTAAGHNVITLADVSSVIETMGRPEDLGADTSDAPEAGQGGPTPPPFNEEPRPRDPIISFNLPGGKHLYRNMQNKVFGGVFGGLAAYLGWNANIMRVLYIVLALCTYAWPCILLYLLAWMIIPEARTPRQILEMNGEPLNVDTVGQAVMASTPERFNSGDGGFWRTFFTIIGKCIMGFFGAVVGCICFACLVAMLTMLIAEIAAIFGSTAIIDSLSLWPFTTAWQVVVGGICALGFLVIFTGMLTWSAFAVVFNFRALTRSAIVTIIISSLMLLIAAGVLLAIGASI